MARKKNKFPIYGNSETVQKAETVSGEEMQLEVLNNGALDISETDPTGSHTFDEEEKTFIRAWLQCKNIELVSMALNWSYSKAMSYISNYYVWNEIQRLEREMAKVKVSRKVMTLDDIQAYLTSTILDYDSPLADRLSARDKLQAVKLLLTAKEMKSEVFAGNGEVIDALPTSNDLQSLSVDTIKALLDTDNMIKTNKEKEQIINELLPLMNLNGEEAQKLKMKSKDELQGMLRESKKIK